MKSFIASFFSPSAEQVGSLVRKAILAFAASYLTQHGFNVTEIDGLVAAFAGLVSITWGHYVHFDPTKSTGTGPVNGGKGVAVIAVLAMVGSFFGCAISRPFATSEATATNGVVIKRTLKSTSIVLWPATQGSVKEILVNADKQALNEQGLKQETGSTNVTEALKALDSIVGRIKP